MGFDDFPKVDDSSKRSENSELAIKYLFKRDTGFICRTETPDYGADFDIELVTDDENVSGFKFAIQAKSTTIYDKVFDGKYVSYKVETSRIGYLTRRTPGMGLFVLYEEDTENCYYDYVENIVDRIIQEKPNDKWKQQEKVSIHIPINNVLNKQHVSKIHEVMLNRKKNHNIMMAHHAESYNLPVLFTVNDSEHLELNLSSEKSVRDWLSFYGQHLIDEQNFSLLSKLVSHLSINTINKSAKLLLFALVSSTETAKLSEAGVYLSKIKKKLTDISKDESNLVELCEIKVNTLLGKLNLEESIKEIESLIPKLNNPYLKLSCELTNLKNKLLTLFSSDEKDFSSLLSEIFKGINSIDESKVDVESKHYFLLNYADYLLGINLAEVARIKVEFDLKNAAGIPPEFFNTKERVKSTLEVYQKMIDIVQSSIEYGQKEENENLLAECLRRLVLYFWSFTLFSNVPKQTVLVRAHNKQSFEDSLSRAFKAHDLFKQIHNDHQAYKSLTLAYETCSLYEYLTEDKLSKEKSDINLLIRDFEDGLDIDEPFVSKTDSMTQSYQKATEVLPGKRFASMTTDELGKYARDVINIFGLPEDRYEIILACLQDHKSFEEANKNTNLVLLENDWNGPQDTYSHKPLYRLYNKSNRYVSKAYDTIDALIIDHKAMMQT